MFKKILNLIIVCPFLMLSGLASANTELPEEFAVTERWLAWTTTFDIQTKTEVIGTVHRKFFALLPEYHLMDVQQNLLAKARMRFFSFMTVFDVEDSHFNSLGIVQEEFSFFFPTFKILAPNGRILGEAVFNFWRTVYTVSDPVDGHTIATLSRPFFRLKNNWTVKIIDANAISRNQIHPHLFMTLIAFQVDKEYWDAERRRRQNELRFESQEEFAFFQKKEVHSEATASEETLMEYYKSTLDSYRSELKHIEPSPADFQAIEKLTEGFNQPSGDVDVMAELNDQMTELFKFLSSDQLTKTQKSALFLMLEHKLNQD